MSTHSLNNLGGDVPPVLSTPLHSASAAPAATIPNRLDGADKASGRFKPDISQLSPFVELHALQRLQQADVTRFQEVTGQIAANLQSAAATARSNGNAAAEAQLSLLATEFTSASQSGQIPDLQHLAADSGGITGASDTSGSSNGSSDSNPLANQYLAGVQSNGESDAQNPLDIVLTTLSSLGISDSIPRGWASAATMLVRSPG